MAGVIVLASTKTLRLPRSFVSSVMIVVWLSSFCRVVIGGRGTSAAAPCSGSSILLVVLARAASSCSWLVMASTRRMML